MSLFICDECKCVENTSCNHPPYDMIGINPDFPNLHSMEMAGFDDEYRKTRVRSPKRLLCSECNTGKWHNSFPKNKATEAEILMGKQLERDHHNIFTFHPLWREYDSDPDNFSMEKLEHYESRGKGQGLTPDRIIYDDLKWADSHEPYVREEPKVGRNDPCPCGGGRKYKKCCGGNR